MERVLAKKANYLAAQGHDLSIITTDQQQRTPYFSLDQRIKQVDLGINYSDLGGCGIVQKTLGYFRKQIQHRQQLAAVLKDQQADIVISMFDHDVSFLPKITGNSKTIVEIHFSRFKRLQYGRKGLWKWADRYRSRRDLQWVKRFDRFVVLTREDAGYWGALPNLKVIPNPNSFETIKPAELTKKRVIAVGRYDYQKGFDHLINAWKSVHAQHPDWQLAIFGNGPLKEQLQAQIDRLKLSSSIQLCAPIQNIKQEYLQSALLAMTSRYEGLPMTLLEAQACGLPLIAYACKCGPKDIIEEAVNGFLIPEGDYTLMAQKINTLIKDSKLRKQMGEASKVRSDQFSEEKVMQQWAQLFKNLMPKTS